MEAMRSVRQYQLTMDLAKERAERLRAEAIGRAMRWLYQRLRRLWVRGTVGGQGDRAADAGVTRNGRCPA